MTFPPELPISARVVDIATRHRRDTRWSSSRARRARARRRSSRRSRSRWAAASRRSSASRSRGASRRPASRRASRASSARRSARDVGYQVRFDDRTSPATYVKFMTDGILLAEIQGDRLLRRYDTLIIDEAHERSLTIDFSARLAEAHPARAARPQGDRQLGDHRDRALLGVLRRRAGHPGRGPHVSRSTCSTSRRPTTSTVPEAVADAVANVTSLDPRGDILVFLPGEREIRETEQRAARAEPPAHRDPAALRAPVGRRAGEGVREHPAASRDPRHERRRDVGHDPGHRLRRRHGRRAPLALRSALGHDAPADRGDLAGERRSAEGPLRSRARRHLRAPLRRGELRGASGVHRSRRSSGPGSPASSCG